LAFLTLSLASARVSASAWRRALPLPTCRWIWRRLNPENMITQLQGTLADLKFSAQSLYRSSLILDPGTTEISLSDKGWACNQVGCVNTSYHDVYGNGCTFNWDK